MSTCVLHIIFVGYFYLKGRASNVYRNFLSRKKSRYRMSDLIYILLLLTSKFEKLNDEDDDGGACNN
jgi:hypothetical protein